MASPFTKTIEYDKSKRASPFKGMYALVIGNFDKGRVGERLFVTTQREADTILGTPAPGCDIAYYILSTLLQKTQRVWVYRVADSPTYPVIKVGSSFVNQIGTGDGSTKSFSGKVKFERCHPGTVTVWLDNEKIGYDDTEGTILGTNLADSCTVDYENGDVTIDFKEDSEAPPSNSKIYVKWGFASQTIQNGLLTLEDYEVQGDISQDLVAPTGKEYDDLLVPYPLFEPDMDLAPIDNVDKATLVVYDGDTAIAYGDEYGNLVDTDSYLADGTQEITEITCNSADTLDGGEYFMIHSVNESFYVWYSKDGVGVDPQVPDATGIEVALSSGDAAGDVGTATQTELDAREEFDVAADSTGAVLTITHVDAGYVPDAEDENTGFSITVTQQGVGSGAVNYTDGSIRFTISDSYTVSDTVSVSFKSRTMYYCLIAGESPGRWANNNYSILINKVNVPNNRFDVTVFEDRENRTPVMVDNYTLSNEYKLDGFERQMFMEERVNDNSYYIRTQYNTYIDEIDDVYPSEMIPHNASKNDYATVYFTDGDEGNAVTVDDYIKAIKEFDNKDDIKVHIFVDTLADPIYQNEIIKACDRDFGGRGDSYGVLYVPFDVEMNTNFINEAIKYRNYTLMTASSFAGLYFGHVQIRDFHNARNIWIPPTGFVAAAFSYTADQYEPWFPAAGWTRGKIPVQDIYRKLSQGHRDALYDNDINAMKFKPGKGIAIWGQKTLYGTASALDRANVRWLLIVAENAIEDFIENYNFDINDSVTRTSVRIAVRDYLRSIELRRGLYEFDVVCDESNNPPYQIDELRMNVDYYLQPTQAAEYIFCRAVITRTGVNFEDVRIT